MRNPATAEDPSWLAPSRDGLSLSSELRDELDRRLEQLDRDGPDGVDWEDVYAAMKTADET